MITREEMKMAELKITSCRLSEDKSDLLYEAMMAGDVQKVGGILYGNKEVQGVKDEAFNL